MPTLTTTRSHKQADIDLQVDGCYLMLTRVIELSVRYAKQGDVEAIEFLCMTAPERAEGEGIAIIERDQLVRSVGGEP